MAENRERQEEEEEVAQDNGRNRPVGVQVVLKAVSRRHSFSHVDPRLVAQDCRELLKNEHFSHQVRGDGSLVVSCSSVSAAKSLLSVGRIADIRVSARISNWYSRRLGRIRHVPLNYTEQLLLESLKDYGVVAVRRQYAYRVRAENNEPCRRMTTSVILHFRPDRHMPPQVFLGFTKHDVEKYFGTPTQCYNCQRYGHTSEFCRHSRRCKNCAGPHSHKECTSPTNLMCANCGGHHASTYSGCPCKTAAYAAIRRERVLTK